MEEDLSDGQQNLIDTAAEALQAALDSLVKIDEGGSEPENPDDNKPGDSGNQPAGPDQGQQGNDPDSSQKPGAGTAGAGKVVPQTGDGSSAGTWAALIFLAAAALTAAAVNKTRKQA